MTESVALPPISGECVVTEREPLSLVAQIWNQRPSEGHAPHDRWGIYCSDRTAGLFAERRKAFGIDPRRAAVARRMGPYCDLLAKPAVKAETALEAGDLSFQIGQPVFGSSHAGLVIFGT